MRSHWDELTRRLAGESDAHAHARELLSGHDISVPTSFTSAELGALRDTGDVRLDAAADAEDGRATQFLAGAPELLARYRNAGPAPRTLIDAATDALRLGMGQAIPSSFLAAAAHGYLSDAEWHEEAAADGWLERALAYATAPCKGASGPLTRIYSRPGAAAAPSAGPVYQLADYLEQHGRRSRRHLIPPVSFWDAAVAQAAPGDLASLARSAEEWGLLRHAAILYKKATLLGGTRAAASLVRILHRLDASDQGAAQWAIAHASLDDPGAVEDLLGALGEAGAAGQVAVLAERAIVHVSLDYPTAVANLLRALREVGATSGQVAVLAERAVAQVSLDDPSDVGYLLDALLDAAAYQQAAALINQDPAAHVSLVNPGAVGNLLFALRRAGAEGQIYALVARDPAAHVSLVDPGAVGHLLFALRQIRVVGQEQEEALAERAAAHSPLDDPFAVANLVFALWKVRAERQLAALVARDPITHVSLDDPFSVASLLLVLRDAGADEQAEALAEHAAAHVPLDRTGAVEYLLGVLRRVGADAQAALLASRLSTGLASSLPAEGVFRDPAERTGADGRFRFGHDPDGSPAGQWSWSDLC